MPAAFYTVDDKTGIVEIVRVVGLSQDQTEELYNCIPEKLNPAARTFVGLVDVSVELLPATGARYYSSCNQATIQY